MWSIGAPWSAVRWSEAVYNLPLQVAGRLHVELMRVSGPLPERLAWGDDSSENSSESGCYEVVDGHGEIVLMAKRLICRVRKEDVLMIYFSWLGGLTPSSRVLC